MTISVKCPKGHKLVVKDEHAGKKVRCPKCQIVMRAPKGVWEAAPTLREAKTVRRPVFLCASGHRFLVLSEHEGQQIRCPLCEQPAGVPVPATVLSNNGQTVLADIPGLAADELSSGLENPLAATALPPGAPNPYAVAQANPVASAQPAPMPRAAERVWPLYLLVGSAAATLVGIAFWLRHTAEL